MATNAVGNAFGFPSAIVGSNNTNYFPRPATNPVPEFLHQLTKILKEESKDIIEWSNGQVVVHDPAKLESDVLHKYFRHSKYSSFQRQMNYFGFRKIAGKGKMSPCSYINDSTTSDMRSLLFIKRKPCGRVASTGTSEKSTKRKADSAGVVPKIVKKPRRCSDLSTVTTSTDGSISTHLLTPNMVFQDPNFEENKSFQLREFFMDKPIAVATMGIFDSSNPCTLMPCENTLAQKPQDVKNGTFDAANFCAALNKTIRNYQSTPSIFNNGDVTIKPPHLTSLDSDSFSPSGLMEIPFLSRSNSFSALSKLLEPIPVNEMGSLFPN